MVDRKKYKITDDQTGLEIVVEANEPPTKQQAAQVIAEARQRTANQAQEGFSLPDISTTALDVGVRRGLVGLEGAGRAAYGVGNELINDAYDTREDPFLRFMELKQGFEQRPDVQQRLNPTPEEQLILNANPTTSQIGILGGEVLSQAPAFLTPFGASSGVGRTVAGAAGGLTSMMTAPETTTEDVITGGAIGAVIPGGQKVIGGGWEFLKSQLPLAGSRKAKAESVRGMTPEQFKAAVETSKKSNHWLTPGEASGDPFLLAMEKRLDSLPEASRIEANQRIIAREKAIQDELQELVGDMRVTDELKNLKREQRMLLPALGLSEGQMKVIMEDPMFPAILDAVNKNPRLQSILDQYPPNSVAAINVYKRVLDKELNKSYKKGSDIIQEVDQDAANRLRKKMLKIGDKAAKDAGHEGAWKTVRSIDQQKIVANKWQKKLDKTPTKKVPGDVDESVDINKVYKRMFSSEEKFNELVNDANNLIDPELKQKVLGNLYRMRTTLAAIDRGVVQKNVTKDNSIWQKRGAVGPALLFTTDNLLGGRFNKEMLEVITSGKWEKQMRKISRMPKTQMADALGILLYKVYESDNDIPQEPLSPEAIKIAKSLNLE